MELGSEYALPVTTDHLCSDSIFQYLHEFDTMYTDSGRSAIRLLEPLLPHGIILLPSYICESVISCFANYTVEFYQVTEEIGIDWDDLFSKINENTSVVYLHYFNGVLPPRQNLKQLLILKKVYNFIILEDTTHSIFSCALTVGDYGVCSLRKWFPVPDGGVVYGKRPLTGIIKPKEQASWVELKAQAMNLKGDYLNNQEDEVINVKYRDLFHKCDNLLEHQNSVFALSSISQNILQQISVSAIIAKRQENLRFLQSNLCNMNLIFFAQTNNRECPLVCPIKIKRRDDLRSFLIDHHIYCAVHWPMEETSAIALSNVDTISRQELSLPIDQRYGKEEMVYLIDMIRQYWRALDVKNYFD